MFIAYYYLDFHSDYVNDLQPVLLDYDFVDADSNAPIKLPATLPLMSSKEKLKCRKVRQVLRYRHSPNIDLYPEDYAHHMLFLFYPFRNENELLLNNSYCHKLADPCVLEIVNDNRKNFEPHADEIPALLMITLLMIPPICKQSRMHTKSQLYLIHQLVVISVFHLI